MDDLQRRLEAYGTDKRFRHDLARHCGLGANDVGRSYEAAVPVVISALRASRPVAEVAELHGLAKCLTLRERSRPANVLNSSDHPLAEPLQQLLFGPALSETRSELATTAGVDTADRLLEATSLLALATAAGQDTEVAGLAAFAATVRGPSASPVAASAAPGASLPSPSVAAIATAAPTAALASAGPAETGPTVDPADADRPPKNKRGLISVAAVACLLLGAGAIFVATSDGDDTAGPSAESTDADATNAAPGTDLAVDGAAPDQDDATATSEPAPQPVSTPVPATVSPDNSAALDEPDPATESTDDAATNDGSSEDAATGVELDESSSDDDTDDTDSNDSAESIASADDRGPLDPLPAPEAGPFVSATLNLDAAPGAGLMTLSGRVPDQATADAVLQAAQQSYAPFVESSLEVDETLDPADWLAVAPNVIGLLPSVTDGTIMVVDQQIQLAARSPNPEYLDLLEDALEVFGNGTPVDVVERRITDLLPPLFAVTAESDAITLGGSVPSEEIVQLLVDGAAASYGPENVTSNLTVDADTYRSFWMNTTPVIFQLFRVFPSYEIVVEDGMFSGQILGGVNFAADSTQITPTAAQALDVGVAVLARDPSIGMEIVGHTDSLGGDEYNRHLSEGRAQSVVDYFVAAGIDPARLVAVGAGETQPVADNETAEGRAQNRRVGFAFGQISGE